jgi:hypothetical protein
MKYVFPAILALALCAPATAQEVTTVSMLRVVAAPEQFHGKVIRVLGFFRCEFEGTVIHPYREDYERALIPNGIWADVPLEDPRCKDLSMGYVLVEGVFDAKKKGHMGMWSGSLTKISRMQEWEGRK